MYYFFIDESGTDGLAPEGKRNNLDANWFTAGGIIVKETDIPKFEDIHRCIIQDYFAKSSIKLPSNFKLHYQELRQHKSHPYNKLADKQRWEIADKMFDAIGSIDCSLVSATINKLDHDQRYEWSVNVRAYTLLLCLERFQYFLEDNNDNGTAVYEKFSKGLNEKMIKELKYLTSIRTFPSFTNLNKIKGRVKNGNPTKDKVLQFADFFVYAPHIKFVTSHKADRRWQQIESKYYNIQGKWNRSGFMLR